MNKRASVVGILALVACAVTLYFHGVAGTDMVFTHLYYPPIILASIWWERRSWFLTAFLSVFLLGSHVLLGIEAPITSDLTRVAMFLVIGGVLVELSRSRRQAREALEASYRYQAGILESMLDAVIVANSAGIIRTVNRAGLELLGYSEEEIIGQPVGSIFEEEEEEEEEEEAFFRGTGLTKLVREGAARDVELTLHTKSGERIPVVFNGSVIKDDDEHLHAVVGVARDMRMTNRLIGELRETRDYVEKLINHANAPIIVWDPELRITRFNCAFEHLTGYTADEVMGKELTMLFTEARRDESLKKIVLTLTGEQWESAEIPILRKDGNVRLVLWNSANIYAEDDTTLLATLAQGIDITERVQAKETLLARERQLAHAARLSALGEMATAMAHEINQPLTIISMAAESISRDIKKDRIDISLLPQDIGDIMTNVKRIDRLITHVRTFARQPGEWKVVEPEQVLNSAFIIVGEQFRVHNVLVSRHIEENLLPLEADPNQLEQVFINILTNARQVLDKKAEVVERAGEIFQKQLVCSIFREGDYVVFEFADNAYGVPEEIKLRVFEPFFTTKEPGEGTGLGLSIAYQIVTHSLSGRIWVEDNETGGASFKVALPIPKKVEK